MVDALGNPQSVLVLGGTSDIGLAIVERLRGGGRLEVVVLAGRPGPRLAAAADRLRAAGVPTVETVPFDAVEVQDHEAAIADAWTKAGRDADVVADALAAGREQAWAPAPLRYLMVVLRHLPQPIFRRLPI